MTRLKTVVLVGLIGLAVTVAAAQGKKAAAGDAKHGEQLFAETCKQCHNTANKETMVGPGLQGLFKGKKMPATKRPVSDAVVKSQIMKGGNGMPGFSSKYKPAEIADLIAYLRTL